MGNFDMQALSVADRDEFLMYSYKVMMCTREDNHDWAACCFAHEKEKARRRCPKRYPYVSLPCPDAIAGTVCPRGDTCSYTHSTTEYWLHPTRYKTQMCKLGSNCTRPLCFFAHQAEELRFPDTPELQTPAAAGPAASDWGAGVAPLAAPAAAAVPLPLAAGPALVAPMAGPVSSDAGTVVMHYQTPMSTDGGYATEQGALLWAGHSPVVAPRTHSMHTPHAARPMMLLRSQSDGGAGVLMQQVHGRPHLLVAAQGQPAALMLPRQLGDGGGPQWHPQQQHVLYHHRHPQQQQQHQHQQVYIPDALSGPSSTSGCSMLSGWLPQEAQGPPAALPAVLQGPAPTASGPMSVCQLYQALALPQYATQTMAGHSDGGAAAAAQAPRQQWLLGPEVGPAPAWLPCQPPNVGAP